MSWGWEGAVVINRVTQESLMGRAAIRRIWRQGSKPFRYLGSKLGGRTRALWEEQGAQSGWSEGGEGHIAGGQRNSRARSGSLWSEQGGPRRALSRGGPWPDSHSEGSLGCHGDALRSGKQGERRGYCAEGRAAIQVGSRGLDLDTGRE